MNLPEGWPTPAMVQAGTEEIYSSFPESRYASSGAMIANNVFKAMFAVAPTPPAPDMVKTGEVLVTVSGFTGSGKSAIAGEIEILCRALGLQVEWIDSASEKNMTHADWTGALERYKPCVRIVERNIPISTPSAQEDEPVGFLDTFYDRFVKHDDIVTSSEGRHIPLYTRPDDRLRKAAEEFLAYLDTNEPVFHDQFEVAISNLRAALEGK